MNLKDIYQDIVHIYLSEWRLMLPKEAAKQSPRSHLGKIKNIFTWFIRDLLNPVRTLIAKKKHIETSPKNKPWLFASSENHFKSLNIIKNHVQESIYVIPHIRNLDQTDFIFPYYTKIFYYPIAFYLIWALRKNKNIKFLYNHIFEAVGTYEISLQVLKKYRPAFIVFANDHIIKHRALLLAAKKLDIKTFYIQHASITKYFPPLKFDYSFLEGLDSLKKYQKIGKIDGEVTLVGMAKFDGYLRNRKNHPTQTKTIGIATNTLDDINYVVDLIKYLIVKLKFVTIVYRSHPLDKRKLKELNSQVEYSDSKKSSPFQFIDGIDFLIAGDSSIHLESALMNCPSAIYAFNNNLKIFDVYDYLKTGLTKHLIKKEIVEYIIKNRFKINPAAIKYYNEAYGSPWEGHSEEKILDEVNKCLTK